MKLKVLSKEGKETGKEIELSKEVFDIQPNGHVLWLAVRQYLAAQRQGTHKSKERSEIARTTKKAYRQKGTGNARRGDLKSPLVRGGGRVFGPKPHSYDFKLNKKVKELARKSALSLKAQNNNIVVFEDFDIESPKTKEFAGFLKNLNLDGIKSTVVFSGLSGGIIKSARNIPSVNVVRADSLNVYDIMNASKLVLSENSVKTIVESFSKN
ncbi:MAG: 50S ribosomal protein L4 [Chitinophagales bacterium]|nr:50S ribosomal protein L4 [Chitinophagales bacterium]